MNNSINNRRFCLLFVMVGLIGVYCSQIAIAQNSVRTGNSWSIQTIKAHLIDPSGGNPNSPDGSFLTLFKCGVITSWEELSKTISEYQVPFPMPRGYALGIVQTGDTAIVFSSQTLDARHVTDFGYKSFWGKLKKSSLLDDFVTAGTDTPPDPNIESTWIDKATLDRLQAEYNTTKSANLLSDTLIYITYINSNGLFSANNSISDRNGNWSDCFPVPPKYIYDDYFAQPNPNHYLQYGDSGDGKSGLKQDDRWFFSGQTGDKIHIELKGSFPRLTILDDHGIALIDTISSSENSVLNYILDQTGIYQIAAQSKMGTQYSISLSADIPPTLTAPPPTYADPTPECSNSLPTRLAQNMRARVISSVLRIRKYPDAPTDDNIGMLGNEDIVTIMSGPQCNQKGLLYWLVQEEKFPQRVGWIAESEGNEFYLEPVS
ncbi:MAG: hypothetical protein H0X31_01745 [Nostocaceae cyanobacterium]|nr:hypothetical protein [Nostocaceae cyanobacterium]